MANPFEAAGVPRLSTVQVAPEAPVNHFKGQLPDLTIKKKDSPFIGTERGKQMLRATTDLTEEEIANLGGVEVPFVDPISAAAGGFAGGALTAARAGAGVAASLGRGMLSGTLAAGTDVPIGQAADIVSEEHPLLAVPFSVLVGMASGVTLERAIEKRVLAALSKGKAMPSPDVLARVTSEVKDAISKKQPEEADSILKLAQEAVVPSAPVTPTANQKATRPLTELAQASQLPPKQGFQRTAEDLLQERVDLAGPRQLEVPDTSRLAPPEPRPISDAGESLVPGRLSPDASETTLELARKYAESASDVGELGKYADSINLERIDDLGDEGIKQLITDTSRDIAPRIDQARRGVISHDETTRMAMRSGITEDKLLKRKPGKIWNAEESLAASMINTASAKQTIDAARKAAESGSAEDLLAFRLIMERHQSIQAAEAGLATEAGRALSARNIIKNAEQRPVKNFQAMIDALGGREVNEEMVRLLSKIDPDNMPAVNRFIQEASEVSTSDKVFEVWVNSLLSSPITHVTNATSNALTFLQKFPEKFAAEGFDALRSAFTGAPRTRVEGEAAAAFYGGWEGLKRGWRNMAWSWQTGLPTDAEAKLEVRTFHAIKGAALPKAAQKYGFKNVGDIIRIPGRALIAADEFFKGLNYHTEIHGLAFRKATLEGLTGDAKSQRIAELITKPPSEMDEAARAEMLYRVFQQPLSKEMRSISAIRMSKHPVWAPFRYIVPFLRTPTNIAKYGLERTPFGYLYIAQRQLSKTPMEAGELADQVARTTMGSMIGAVTFGMAMEGHISGGGPKNRAERDALYRTGWQPYSIKVGDQWVSYGRLEPLGSVLGIAADMAETAKTATDTEWQDLAFKMTLSISKNVTSKTFLRGISQALDATSDPTRYGPAWIEGLTGTVVPRVVASAARASDDTFRETEGIGEYIRSQIPFLSEELMPKRNLWGEEIRRPGTAIERFASPIRRSNVAGTQADDEMVRLKVSAGKPSKSVTILGHDRQLTPQQYDELLVRGGAEAQKRIQAWVHTKGYERLPDEMKAKQLKQRYDSAMDLTRTRLKNEMMRAERAAIRFP